METHSKLKKTSKNWKKDLTIQNNNWKNRSRKLLNKLNNKLKESRNWLKKKTKQQLNSKMNLNTISETYCSEIQYLIYHNHIWLNQT